MNARQRGAGHDRAVACPDHRADVAVRYAIGAKRKPTLELHPVEVRDPRLRAEPEVAVPILEHDVHRVVGQTVLGLPQRMLPGPHDILRRRGHSERHREGEEPRLS